jgi:predicted Rossmann-fold nucleotide-binding protein
MPLRARALVVFPGGLGTLDELTEILAMAQTLKLSRPIPVILYGPGYWNEIINFDALLRHDMICREDFGLFRFADDPVAALGLLQDSTTMVPDGATPAFAHSCARSPLDGTGLVQTPLTPP